MIAGRVGTINRLDALAEECAKSGLYLEAAMIKVVAASLFDGSCVLLGDIMSAFTSLRVKSLTKALEGTE
jgi:hypothetical protein